MSQRGTAWAVTVGLGLFLMWSNSFVAGSYLLGGERHARQMDAVALTAARYALVTPLCLLWCFGHRRRETLALVRRFPVRATAGGLLAAPFYCLALYSGQQRGVPPPVASITTALTPFFVMFLAALFLGEPVTRRKLGAFVLAIAGLGLIAASRLDGATHAAAGAGTGPKTAGEYAALIALVALAPLCWSAYSILSKPVAGVASPLDWTALTLALGGLPLLVLLPFRGWREMAALDGAGWTALLFLSVLCTIVGYPLWGWLLKHLPASSVGFFTFLNPPLTLLSKLALALLLPATFVWTMEPLELAGAALALAGLALVLFPARSRRPPPVPAEG
jgi:drug/metabolite transporter (DMT)-like permease